jgi:hypothetical protein
LLADKLMQFTASSFSERSPFICLAIAPLSNQSRKIMYENTRSSLVIAAETRNAALSAKAPLSRWTHTYIISYIPKKNYYF